MAVVAKLITYLVDGPVLNHIVVARGAHIIHTKNTIENTERFRKKKKNETN